MILKVSGAVFVILATTVLGVKRADDMQEEYRQMRYLQRMLYVMESEIRYAHSHLGEIFSRIERYAKEPYRTWLYAMRREMSLGEGKVFEEIWRQAVEEYLPETGLPGVEIDRLIQLGEQLGVSDIDHQLGVLGLYHQQLTMNMEKMNQEMGSRVRLCRCLGVMSGMLIAILLF